MDPNEIADIAKAVPPEVAREAYRDLASGTFKEGGKLALDIAKTARLVLFPFQLAAALQDRFAGYIDRAIRQVPPPRLIAPMESVMLPVAEKLRFQEASNPVTDLYINLLSRAMDGERVGEAHPAFVGVISQLAPDEVVFLRELSKHEYTLILKMNEQWDTPTPQQVQQAFVEASLAPHLVEKSNSIIFDYRGLNQPDMFYVFLEHLYHLGLVQYTNEPRNSGEYQGMPHRYPPRAVFVFIKLSSFGRLFYRACVSHAPDEATRAEQGIV
jgi:hypothetical protein